MHALDVKKCVHADIVRIVTQNIVVMMVIKMVVLVTAVQFWMEHIH